MQPKVIEANMGCDIKNAMSWYLYHILTYKKYQRKYQRNNNKSSCDE